MYLSLPIDSAGHCTRYANTKVFSEPHFPLIRQNPRTYTQKCVSEKTRIFPCFTQPEIFHPEVLLPENYALLNRNNRHCTDNK